MVPMWMFPVALVTGNCFISNHLSVIHQPLLLAQWLSEAGVPDGVFHVVQGDKLAVDTLLTHRYRSHQLRRLNSHRAYSHWHSAWQKRQAWRRQKPYGDHA